MRSVSYLIMDASVSSIVDCRPGPSNHLTTEVVGDASSA
jgi:hypothetical protein